MRELSIERSGGLLGVREVVELRDGALHVTPQFEPGRDVQIDDPEARALLMAARALLAEGCAARVGQQVPDGFSWRLRLAGSDGQRLDVAAREPLPEGVARDVVRAAGVLLAGAAGDATTPR